MTIEKLEVPLRVNTVQKKRKKFLHFFFFLQDCEAPFKETRKTSTGGRILNIPGAESCASHPVAGRAPRPLTALCGATHGRVPYLCWQYMRRNWDHKILQPHKSSQGAAFPRRRLYLRSAPQAEVQTVRLSSCSHSPHYSPSLPTSFAADGRFTTLKLAPAATVNTPSRASPFPPLQKKVPCLFSWEGALTGIRPTQRVLKKKTQKERVQRGTSPAGRPRPQLEGGRARNHLSRSDSEEEK